MNKKYRVVFQGLTVEKDDFKADMARLAVPAEAVDMIIKKAPVVLKEGLTLADARRYADAVQEAGGRVMIQENGFFEESRRINRAVSITSFKEFTMCAECGFKQPKGEVCVKCGFKL